MITKNPHSIARLPLSSVFDDTQPLLLQASVLRAAKACIETCEGQFPSPHQRDQTALLVAASGKFDCDVNANLVKLSRMLWEGLGFGWATVGFDKAAWPPLSVSLEHIYRLGFRRIVMFPWMLFPDNQLSQVCTLMNALQSQDSDITIVLTAPFDAYSVPRQIEVEKGKGLCNCFQCNYRSSHHHDVTSHNVDTPGHHHS